MDTIIIGQGYNLQENTSVGKELLELFRSHRYSSFTCLVAFASFGGVSALSEEINEAKRRNCKIKVILGVDQGGTSKEALEEVLTWGVDAKIYHTVDFNIFHPKIYLFENEDIFCLIVGSNNLTVPGLVQNVECSLMVKDIRSNPVLGNFYTYWKGILEGTEVNLRTLTKELIDDMYQQNIITLEEQRKERYDRNDKLNLIPGKGTKAIFGSSDIQKFPVGFSPKQKARHIKVTVRKGEETRSRAKHKLLKLEGDQILISEIGGGPRWKQVNFPIEIFQDFFGAPRNDNTYTISLTNITRDGTLGETETRQAVTVRSNNFRFEIRCQETLGSYPGNEKRPIGLFVKLEHSKFLYQVIMPDYPAYEAIRKYLYIEAKAKRKGELMRVVRSVEAIHALYPELIV